MNRSPVARKATGVLRVISRLGQSKRGANFWWSMSELPADLEGDVTALPSGGRRPPIPRGCPGVPLALPQLAAYPGPRRRQRQRPRGRPTHPE